MFPARIFWIHLQYTRFGEKEKFALENSCLCRFEGGDQPHRSHNLSYRQRPRVPIEAIIVSYA
jgi:hypothetical protein